MKFYAKMITVLFVLFVVLNVCIEKVRAEGIEKKDEKTFSLSGEIGIFAPYVSEYTGEYVSGSVVTQPSMTLAHNPSGAYVSALGFITNQLDEVDLFGGKETEIKGVTLDTGVGFYNAENMNNTDDDFWAIYAGADFPEVIGIIPFAYIEANIPFHKYLVEGGVLWKVGAKKSIEIAKQAVDFKIEVGGNDGIYGSEAKLISFARGTASTDFEVFGLKLSPSLTLQKGFGGIAGYEWRTIGGLTFLF